MNGETVERRRIWIRLDQEPDAFRPRLATFLDALGERAEADPSSLNVVDVRSGCVIIVIETPDDVADRLLSRLRPSNRPDESDDPITRDWRLEAVRTEEPEAIGQFSFHRDPPPSTSWLHLSDLHVAEPSEDQEIWMEGVERDVPRLLHDRQLVPDVVIVSGDIAKAGQPTEYESALDFFERISKRLPRPDVPWVFAPGNHDVCWDDIDRQKDVELRTSMREVWDDNGLRRLISEKDSWTYLIERQANYRDFTTAASERLGTPIAALNDAAPTVVVAGKVDIGIAALNSALLSTRKDLFKEEFPDGAKLLPDLDLQNLAVGQRALRRALKDVEGTAIRIAVLHHPPLSEWFHMADQQPQRTYLGEFDFIHRGHEHVPSQTRRNLAGIDDGVFEVASGALHVTEKWYRGFCAVGIDHALEHIATHYFTHGLLSDRWIPDVETAGGGRVLTRIPQRLAMRMTGRERADRPT